MTDVLGSGLKSLLANLWSLKTPTRDTFKSGVGIGRACHEAPVCELRDFRSIRTVHVVAVGAARRRKLVMVVSLLRIAS